eukprot:TRINITY_DN3046_c0_g1_i2.p1 TRINITY_DN3046_c0_g1~~TRINITY_DN3046_c0_g1_i2.p1  ORF type:complete len:543 (+),score=187.59 TRINITY_DN3046_c0_g1_i2:37-1665(+)
MEPRTRSLYRNNLTKFEKKENITDVRPTDSSVMTSMVVNTKYIAYIDRTASKVGIFDRQEGIRVGRQCYYVEYGGKINFVAWDPFNENRLAIACENGDVCFWNIPANVGELDDVCREPAFVFSTHGVNARCVKFNPAVSDIVAVHIGNKLVVTSFNPEFEYVVETELDGTVSDLAWNEAGNVIYAVYQFERSSFIAAWNVLENAILGTMETTFSTRNVSVGYVNLLETFAIFGASSKRNRAELIFYNASTLEQTCKIEVGASEGRPVLLIDQDLAIAYAMVRSSGMIRAYELIPNDPGFYKMNNHSVSFGLYGFDLAPKSSVDHNKNEVDRIYAVADKEVIAVHFYIPRRTDIADPALFPNTFAAVPGASAEEFVAGKVPELVRKNILTGEIVTKDGKAPTVEIVEQPEAEVVPVKASKQEVVEEPKEEAKEEEEFSGSKLEEMKNRYAQQQTKRDNQPETAKKTLTTKVEEIAAHEETKVENVEPEISEAVDMQLKEDGRKEEAVKISSEEMNRMNATIEALIKRNQELEEKLIQIKHILS